MSQTKEDKSSTDFAIDTCKENITRHRFQSSFFLTLLLAIPIFAGFYFYTNALQEDYLKESLLKIASATSSSATSDTLTKLYTDSASKTDYILYALLILVFGVFTSFYRFHLKEIAKYEHFHVGLMRIKIAAHNSEKKYETEVRQALTNDAFSYDTKATLINKEKRVESPVSGHLSSDIGTAIINKVLDSIEVITKKKEKD